VLFVLTRKSACVKFAVCACVCCVQFAVSSFTSDVTSSSRFTVQESTSGQTPTLRFALVLFNPHHTQLLGDFKLGTPLANSRHSHRLWLVEEGDISLGVKT